MLEQGWNNPEGDRFFQNQRQNAGNAENADDKMAQVFYKMMQDIGNDMHRLTGVLQIKSQNSDSTRILDMCMAPGSFLATALRINPEAEVLGFSLPVSEGATKFFYRVIPMSH